MNTFPKLLIILFISTLFTQCVSTKKYNELLELNNYAAEELKDYKEIKENEEKQRKELITLNKEKQANNQSIESNKLKINTLVTDLQDLQNRYDELLTNNKSILETVGTEKAKYNSKLSSKANEIDKQRNELRILEETLKTKEDKLSTLSKTLNDQQEKLKEQKDSLQVISDRIGKQSGKINELTSILNKQNKDMTNLKSSISDALTNFSNEDLNTTLKDGKLYISMSQELLFKSGSKMIDPKGQDALLKLAEVLNANNNVNIIVEGHTDSDGNDKANWALSVARAVSVVDILQTSGVSPSRMTASGKGEFQPIAENDNTDGKSLNRRTEIILTPDLTSIRQILN